MLCFKMITGQRYKLNLNKQYFDQKKIKILRDEPCPPRVLGLKYADLVRLKHCLPTHKKSALSENIRQVPFRYDIH